jgi:hypothetical protein
MIRRVFIHGMSISLCQNPSASDISVKARIISPLPISRKDLTENILLRIWQSLFNPLHGVI